MHSNNGNLCQGVKASPCLAPSGEMANNNMYLFIFSPEQTVIIPRPGWRGGGEIGVGGSSRITWFSGVAEGKISRR